MRLLTRTHSSSGDYDGDCTYAVIEIDAATILKRRELLQMVQSKDDSIVSLTFRDLSTRFYATYEDLFELVEEDMTEDTFQDNICDGTPIRLKDEGELPPDQRTECDRLITHDDFFYWECRPKHAEINVETEAIKYEELLK